MGKTKDANHQELMEVINSFDFGGELEAVSYTHLRAIKYSVCEYVLKISIIDELPLAVEKAIGKLSRLKKEIEIQEHTKAEAVSYTHLY